ncbi:MULTISPECIES: nuclear transport factor 2 family protein [unclassified Sphingobium]|uniref:nuclear transport factor 2 family protein n=1 Tax=unclassified Sphingobium TaxID=2611147 RepID=UPI0022241235|nr:MULTISPECIES: nuclear transport factor 2 family protein [unclassified Sphingobium]MCW2411326.1 ketosteroid isomerase-like protein [Sphingobium sp. B8D3D]MCW2416382.1 ketosteroid isomerase-like protein [Sphingobium sp. B8D3A]
MRFSSAVGKALILALFGSLAQTAVAAENCPSPGMTKADFERYFLCFNARDYACFTSYYDADVVLVKGGKWPDLKGREAIIAFYRDVDARGLQEHVTPHAIEVQPQGATVDLEAHFQATSDWPDFGSRPLKAGDDWRLRGVLLYEIPCGKITRIRPRPRPVQP